MVLIQNIRSFLPRRQRRTKEVCRLKKERRSGRESLISRALARKRKYGMDLLKIVFLFYRVPSNKHCSFYFGGI